MTAVLGALAIALSATALSLTVFIVYQHKTLRTAISDADELSKTNRELSASETKYLIKIDNLTKENERLGLIVTTKEAEITRERSAKQRAEVQRDQLLDEIAHSSDGSSPAAVATSINRVLGRLSSLSHEDAHSDGDGDTHG